MAGHLSMFVTDTIELSNFRFSQDLWNVQDQLRVENLPPHVDNNYITASLITNPPNGERVTHVQYFPEKSSALVEFSDYKVVDTYLIKKLFFNESPMSVFPCYVSLDTALHGREELFRKLPAPFLVALDPFIRMNLAEKVSPDWNENYKRGRGHCEVTWPQVNCTGLESKYHFNPNKKVASTQTKEGLKLVLISGNVSCFCADVIVNTVPVDLQLGRGSLSQSLLCKAGPMLQTELNATRQETEEKVGSIFMTSGCNLNCKAVLHVVAPDWDNGAGSSWQIMANIIKKCLMTVEQLSFSSITFPMIGTGDLGFPKTVFAELILSEVSKFSSSVRLKTLQKVYFLVHLDDDESHKAFLDKFSRWSSGNPNKERILMVGNTQGIFGTVTCPWPTVYEMKIGAITFQVAIGDIAKESADVIVNSTTRMFNLKLGVSKAILEGAGPAVEDECAVLATQPHRDFIVTQGGFLSCDIIIHVLGENDVRKSVSSVLEECEQRKYTSIALPAIGTGNAGKNPIRVADDIINAIVDFTWKHSTPSLKKVKVVIFVTELLNVFYDSMKKREGIATSPTFQSTFSEAAYNIPEYWSDVNQQLFCVIQLQPGQSEYDTVKNRFSQTCLSYRIEKIERIQNEFLWQSYQIKKKHMDIKNGHIDNEKILFHGTDAHSVPHVNQHGFNRSYAGKNAVAYGKGTYFAVDASYSADDRYSRPDSTGRKHIYVVRVLTGVYTLGREGIVTPPPKNPYNSIDLFDSVTDDIQHPKLFVVFFDNQAYPEYLITFRC